MTEKQNNDTTRMVFYCDTDFKKRVIAYQHNQQIASQSEALKQLIEIALKANEQKK